MISIKNNSEDFDIEIFFYNKQGERTFTKIPAGMEAEFTVDEFTWLEVFQAEEGETNYE